MKTKPWNHFPVIVVLILLGYIYTRTLAPGLTWANAGADGGDLISAAYVGGVAHPTGYPLYLFLAYVFELLPIKTVAFRTNLLSMTCALLMAWTTYQFTYERAEKINHHSALAATFASLSIGLSPAVWGQAIITEVYTLHLLLISLVIWQVYKPNPAIGFDIWRGITFGLCISNQITGLVLLPLLFFTGENFVIEIKKTLNRLLWAGLTSALLYSTLILRAWNDPLISWGIPKTPIRLFWLVSGQMYQEYLSFDGTELFIRFRLVLGSFILQFGILGLLICLAGLLLVPSNTSLRWLTLLLAGVLTVFVVSYDTQDAFIYLLPVYWFLAVWGGLAMQKCFHFLRSHWGTVRSLLLLLLILGVILGSNAMRNFPTVDASHDDRANIFARKIMREMPANALIFTTNDYNTFSLWYYQFVLRERQDISIISLAMLEQDWYPEMLASAYPDLIIPDKTSNFRQAIVDANQGRPACDLFATFEPAYICP